MKILEKASYKVRKHRARNWNGTGQKWAQELRMTETLELGCGAAAAALIELAWHA